MREQITVLPGTVSGRIQLPASAGLSHLAILCAALAEGDSTVRHITWSSDIEATIYALERMGAIVWRDEDTLTIRGIGGASLKGKVERIFCGESAATARLLIPVAGVLGLRAIFTGMGRLPRTSLKVYYDLMEEHGFAYERESEEELPLLVKGQWKNAHFRVSGSSEPQFLAGLLMALPMLEGESTLEFLPPLRQRSYIESTVDLLRRFGIRIEKVSDLCYQIPGGQKYRAGRYVVEADYSQAAFLLAAGAVAGEEEGLILDGLDPDSVQKERAVLDVLKDLDVQTEWIADGGLKVYPSPLQRNKILDLGNTPDLVPAVAVIGAFGEGTLRITNVSELRQEEFDLLKTLTTEFRKMGVLISQKEDGLAIQGEPDGLFEGGEAESAGDHRMVLALTVLALRTFRGIDILGVDCMQKTWPSFWGDLYEIGGAVETE